MKLRYKVYTIYRLDQFASTFLTTLNIIFCDFANMMYALKVITQSLFVRSFGKIGTGKLP